MWYNKQIIIPILLYISLLGFGLSYGITRTQGYFYFPVAMFVYWFLLRKEKHIGLWALVLVWGAAMLDTAGNIYRWYGTLRWFDDLAHAYAIGTITLFTVPIITAVYPRLSLLQTACIAFLFASFIGVLYEIGELWTQELTGIRILWGEKDAPQDLQWNTIGSLIAVTVLFLAIKKRDPATK